jgi:hypothetical protein
VAEKLANARGLIVAVDFDGTIAEHEFPDIGAAVPGAFKWLKKWQAAGARLVLWTMRDDMRCESFGPVLTQAVEFCRRNGVEFWGVNGNPEQKSWTQSPKAYANVYVDDAAFGCPLMPSRKNSGRPMVNWAVVGPKVLKMIESF